MDFYYSTGFYLVHGASQYQKMTGIKTRVTWKERVSLLAVNDEWNSAVYPLQEPRLKIKPSLVLVLIPIQISPFGLFPDL
jgi:hypothetical protein